MAGINATKNLQIPLLQGADVFGTDSFNRAYERIDEAALSVEHVKEKLHFAYWQKNTAYKENDVVRVKACPSWGVLVCDKPGTTDEVEPAGFYNVGDAVQDGTVRWLLQSFMGLGEGGAGLWINGKKYEKNMLCVYNRQLYRCVKNHMSGLNFDPTLWQLMGLGNLPEWQANTLYEEHMAVAKDRTIYCCTTGHISQRFETDLPNWQAVGAVDAIVPDWQAGETYSEAALVVHDASLYRCLSYHTSYDFAADKAAGEWETLLPYGAVVLNWRAQKEYEAGETVRYGAYLYRAKAAHTAGNSFTPADWELLANSYLPDWQAGAKYEPLTAVVVDNVVYRCKAAHTAADFEADAANWQQLGSEDVVLADWTANTKYKARQLVLHERRLWRSKSAHTSGAGFSAADWTLADVDCLPDWQAGEAYVKDVAVVVDGVLYRCVTPHTAANFSAEESNWQALGGKSVAIGDWQSNTKYVEKQNVVYGRRLYRAKAAHTSGASFTAAQWELADVCCIPDWQAGESYVPEMAVAKDSAVYRCKTAHTAVNFAIETVNWEQISGGLAVYTQGKTYNPGQVVLRNGLLYLKK